MPWLLCWFMALSTYGRGAAELTDQMTPRGWVGNPWGPAATRAREQGGLPPIPVSASMARLDAWGETTLRDGDIVFRMGDARTVLGWFPLSHLIARATASPFSHTGIVAIENGHPYVYDSSSSGIQRQPFGVWMLDCIGAYGVKRLKPEHRSKIPGVLAWVRDVFERQVPFDPEFRMDDSKLYCLEMTEKAFRSRGLALSEPVRIGDWEDLTSYPITTFCVTGFSRFMLDRPIELDQPVYLPGNDHSGVWASPLLETVYCSAPRSMLDRKPRAPDGLGFRGDLTMSLFFFRELWRSYDELPARWIYDELLAPLASSRDERPNPTVRL